MKTLLKFLGYIVAFLLMAAGLVALVLYVMGLANGNNFGNIITTMPPVVTATPAPDGNVSVESTQQNGTSSVTMATPTPVITPTPIPDVTPEPTPEPTPTPKPEPEGKPLGGGTISSTTGTYIDLDAVWTAETVDSQHAKITVVANLRSYSLNTGKKTKLDITVDGQTASLTADAIFVDKTNEAVTTELGTYTFEVEAPQGMLSAIPIEATWHFGGTYSGKPLPKITVSDKVELNRVS